MFYTIFPSTPKPLRLVAHPLHISVAAGTFVAATPTFIASGEVPRGLRLLAVCASWLARCSHFRVGTEEFSLRDPSLITDIRLHDDSFDALSYAHCSVEILAFPAFAADHYRPLQMHLICADPETKNACPRCGE
jgi:hypothetical protein